MIVSIAGAVLLAATALAASDEAETAAPALERVPERIQLNYSGSVWIVPVAQIGVSAVFPTGTYSASTTFESAGLARWFDDTDIHAGVTGYRAGTALQPWRYEHLNRASGKGRTVGIDFPEAVATPDIDPPFGSMGQPAASEEEREGAIDPVSALLGLTLGMPVGEDGVCAGRLPVFDGKARYDLRFERGGTERVRTRAWTGDAIVCQAYVEPISGYDPGDRPTEEETRRPVTIYLAAIHGHYVPVRFRAPTPIGEANIQATRIEVE